MIIMEIKFALWQYKQDELGELKPTDPIVVSTWEEIRAKAKEGYRLQGLTYSICQMFKALEYNEYFLKERERFRKEFQIPARVSFKKYLEHSRYFAKDKKITKKNFITSPFFKEICFLGKVVQAYRMPNHIKELLRDLFYTGVVRFIPPFGGDVRIAIYPKQRWLHPKEVRLEITSPHMTKNALKKFIDLHWEMLQPYILALPAENNLLITEHDLEIMRLRKENKTISNVATEMYLAMNPGDVRYGKEKEVKEATVKTAYFRAKEKIDELFRPVGQKKKKMR